MILRRVIEHFRRQEWTAIAIDFVIVVTGVFIGIQVANWNAAIADQKRAQAYLERIGEDLDADIRTLENRVLFWDQVSRFGIAGLAYAESDRAPAAADWPLLLAYFQASQVGEFYVTNATYEEIKSAGELSLISDPELRGRLAFYYLNSGNPALTERPAYRQHVRGIIPIDVQLYIWDECFKTGTGGGQELKECPSPIPAARVAELVQRISGDAALMGELRYWVSSMKVARLIAESHLEIANEMRAAIDASLARD